MPNLTQVAITVPNVNLILPMAAGPAQTSIGLSDGTTWPVSAGANTVVIPLTSEPAARAGGLRRVDGQTVPCKLLQAPAGSSYFAPGATVLLPDGLTQTTISAAGTLVVPVEFVALYQTFGFRVLV